MKKSLSIGLFITNILLSFPGFATPEYNLANQVEKLIETTLANASVGILLQDAKTGKILYERRSQEPFPPASTTKLFTVAAALLNLHPDYQYKTTMSAAKNAITGGKLTDTLYIQFTGDPSLTTHDVTQLIKDLKVAGITHIQGNIIIDASRFEGPTYSMGVGADSLPWYFAAPITTVILNENKIKISINSDKPLGSKVEVAIAAEEPIKIPVNSDKLVTVTELDAKDKCQIQLEMNADNELTLMGCWPQTKTPTDLQVAIKNPNRLVEKFILQTLQSENMTLDGKIEVKNSAKELAATPLPKDLIILASHSSKPLNDLLGPLLLDSNNVYAESLTKTMGYEKNHIGTIQMGVAAIKDALAKPTGIDFSKMRLLDGSGGSRYNLVTPRQLGQLLLAMYQDKTYESDFRQFLPSFGESGTLQSRQNDEVKGKLRAKTGSMMNISTLAGYLTPDSNTGKEMIVVIMSDHLLERGPAIDFENALCQLFLVPG